MEQEIIMLRKINQTQKDKSSFIRGIKREGGREVREIKTRGRDRKWEEGERTHERRRQTTREGMTKGE